MRKILIDDTVMVTKGKDKGKTGKIKKILGEDRVIVEGLNIVKKAMRPTQNNQTGGITTKEATVHISNVALLSPKTNKPTRVRIEEKDGKRVRVAVACGTVISK
ncbi:MAG: 50S ribosomal protein L24 [Bdellovibrionales bacterium RIFOXYD12_FULL_39_22]|nr:MAG: 50S ribosomal protein L24 [Bdellovibrionales bacterium RIFOXYB1_FULL_39_21]OFZ43372.1 MAG: 50S ribosomal protein L24 [Bdellovibrionales bacterium RIFOXYC12_FULL_39_17]OFZ47403.1 MAG: 50S ribosomal protein L24 [Bdellovibrionales bacterium RIFOXYC1_FULL_39_130]OFZ73854.1 MAG: 50S ribosomal protein L24 [Bdellovibrionales bacterium RIFOXYC2_FULL_39_8]OFZ76283.1 MAG: 50S ribosomal protein L24 [Bdellovibrionales bacterium RIFOXYD1_FULL_39_84]OFZ94321.1 MAG: 50S ribosomal protein L24 [Bdellov